ILTFSLLLRPPPISTLFPYTNALPISDDDGDDDSGTGVTYMGYDVIGYIEIPKTDVEYPIIPDYQGSINALNVGIVKLYPGNDRSEEHTSELQSRFDLVCRLLLEKKKQ